MRFNRRPRVEGLTWTARREAAYLRRHKRAQEKIDREYPLFAHQFAPAPMNDVDAEKERRERMALAGDQRMRNLEAKHWREGRAEYFACEPSVRGQIIAEWRGWRGPARAGYFTSSKSTAGLLTKERGSIAPESRSCAHRSGSSSMLSVPWRFSNNRLNGPALTRRLFFELQVCSPAQSWIENRTFLQSAITAGA